MSSQGAAARPRIQTHARICCFVVLVITWANILGFCSQNTFAEESTPTGAQGFTQSMTSPASQAAAWHLPPATNTVSYWFGPAYKTVFVTAPNSSEGASIARNTVEFQHTSFWKLGSNFADVYVNRSSSAELTAGNSGATEVYGIFRSKFGLNELTATHKFQFGPVRDIALEAGANLETKNSAYGPAERTIYAGPNVQLKVPHGFFDIGFHVRKEWNKEEILHKAENYTPSFNIEPSWMFPINAGKIHLAYNGCADYNTQKGTDSFGNSTVDEFMLRSYVTVDIGTLIFHQPERLLANGGFWYWHNEFGKPSSDPGGEEMTPIFGVSYRIGGIHKGK